MTISYRQFIARKRVAKKDFLLTREVQLALSDSPNGLQVLNDSGYIEGFVIVAKEKYDLVRKTTRDQ